MLFFSVHWLEVLSRREEMPGSRSWDKPKEKKKNHLIYQWPVFGRKADKLMWPNTPAEYVRTQHRHTEVTVLWVTLSWLTITNWNSHTTWPVLFKEKGIKVVLTLHVLYTSHTHFICLTPQPWKLGQDVAHVGWIAPEWFPQQVSGKPQHCTWGN